MSVGLVTTEFDVSQIPLPPEWNLLILCYICLASLVSRILNMVRTKDFTSYDIFGFSQRLVV